MIKVIFVVMLILVICAGCYVANEYEDEEEYKNGKI